MDIRYRTRTSLCLLAVTIAAALGFASCSYRVDGCNVDPDCGGVLQGSGSGSGSGSGGEVTPPSCVPSKNADPIDNTCGVFVRVTGDDTNAGTKTSPLGTIKEAIARAMEQGKPVYVCAQEFKESVEIPEGVTIFGGLDCKSGWTYVGPATKTKILPDADRIPLKFVKGGSGAIHIEDVEATAADATIPSGSSIAAIADAVTVELVRVDLFAGAGKFGNDGTMPTDNLGPTDPNDMAIAGNNGASACMGSPSGGPGGDEKKNPLCMESVGGKGGNGQGPMSGDKGLDGLPADDVFGLGGKPVDATGCMNGGNGNSGGLGTAGVGAQKSDIGILGLGNGYEGKAGMNGSPGKVGQGAGGGGGGKGNAAGTCFGAGGGGGGAGGCGGRGGTGGHPGGASIGLISLGAKLTFDTVTITTSNGGNGGSGGEGQDGAVGGNGGKGGTASSGASAACGGGTGGPGGKGGMGGGGRGGHSIGIAFTGAPTQLNTTGATIKIGTAGDGGVGEGPSGAGIKGEEAETFPFSGE